MARSTNKRNKRFKRNLVFDESERKDYLTGFQKRKAERKLKAKENIDKKVKEEKSRIKAEKKESMSQLYLQDRAVPEVDHLVEPVIYDLDTHLVTVTEMDTTEIAGSLGFSMGMNHIVMPPERPVEKEGEAVAAVSKRKTGKDKKQQGKRKDSEKRGGSKRKSRSSNGTFKTKRKQPSKAGK